MAAACKVCEQPLVLVLEPEEEGEETLTYPDDLELQCHCHFHWQCLLDQSSEILSSMKCPVCDSSFARSPPTQAGGGGGGGSSSSPSSSSLVASTPPSSVIIATTYTNEGGVQRNLDILPDLQEEAYVEANPDTRLARALQVMCAEGDAEGMVELLLLKKNDDDDDDDDDSQPLATAAAADMLRYRDPFASGATSLHLAVENFRFEIAWLVLWMASPLPPEKFPAAVRRHADLLPRPSSSSSMGGDDIRAVKNDAGQTAGDVARNIGGEWEHLISNGIFDP